MTLILSMILAFMLILFVLLIILTPVIAKDSPGKGCLLAILDVATLGLIK